MIRRIPMRRIGWGLILLAPAVALIAWLVVAQLPRWTAPTRGWFAPETPGVCAAAASLAVYQAVRGGSPDAISPDQARAVAEAVAGAHYDAPVTQVSAPLAVWATLPEAGGERRAYAVVTARLGNDAPEKAAVIYLDAGSGEPRALLTAVEDPAAACDFDLRAALVAVAKSPPLLLLAAYGGIIAGAWLARRLVRRRLR